jgi:hypothetical protein
VDVFDTKGIKFLLYYVNNRQETFQVVETIGKKNQVKKDDDIINIIDFSDEHDLVQLLYLN